METGEYVIELIRSLFAEKKALPKPDNISFEDIYSFAMVHNISSMILYAIEKTGESVDSNLLNRWNKKRNTVIAQSAVQLSEKQKIIDAFKEHSINCLPLKGCLLKEMYPQIYFREMSDLDILIAREKAYDARDVMESMGYSCESFGTSNEDQYIKNPFMHVELHFELLEEFFASSSGIKNSSFLVNPWAKALPTEDPFLYRFSWEDFYVFLIAHLHKHFVGSGVGIRQFIDLWVVRKHYELNREYVYSELDKMGILDFCKDAEELVDCWMSGAELRDSLKEMQEYVFRSGSYGTLSNGVLHLVERNVKENESANGTRKYLFKRIFPPLDIMKIYHPVLRKYVSIKDFPTS